MANVSVSSARKSASIRAASRRSANVEAEPIKVYKSTVHPGQWIAYSSGTGWVIFPAKANGWEERRNARGLDPMYLRQVPLEAALDSGIMDALRSADDGKAA